MEESAELLEYLCAFMEGESGDVFKVKFKWTEGALCFWDNRCTQHRPVNDYWPQHRKLQRITIDGDRPF